MKIKNILLFFLKPFTDMLYIVLPVYLVGYVIGILEKIMLMNYYSRFGMLGVKITSFIGTPFHELSHALMAILFGHKIEKIQLFNFNLNGVQGYVNHTYNPNNFYHLFGNFFIGIAPLILGSLFIILLYRILLKEDYKKLLIEIKKGIVDFKVETFFKVFAVVLKSIFSIKNIKSIKYWIFLIISFNIAFHMSLSMADILGSIKGLLYILFLFFILRIIPIKKIKNKLDEKIKEFQSIMFVFLSISLIFNIINFLLSLIVKVG